MEDNLEEHVAQFVLQPLHVAGVDRLQGLVRLLQQVRDVLDRRPLQELVASAMCEKRL